MSIIKTESERYKTPNKKRKGAISDQFFAWLAGFGRRVKIMGPQSVVDQYAAFLDKIREMY